MLTVFRHLERVLGVIYAPKGLQDSAQGFNPGNPQINEFALKLKGERLT